MHWHSDHGNLYFNILLGHNMSIEMQPQLLTTNLVVYCNINCFSSKLFSKLDCKLKWFNDMLICNETLSGIIFESVNLQINKLNIFDSIFQ